MKRILAPFFSNLLFIYFAGILIPGFVLRGGLVSFLSVALALTLINLLILPLARFFTAPLRWLTLGLFSLALNVLAILALDFLFLEVEILPFKFSGFSSSFLIIPSLNIPRLGTALLASLLISFGEKLVSSVFS